MDHVKKRKNLRKAAARRLGVPENELGWARGELVFLSTGTPVEGVPRVEKPTEFKEHVPASPPPVVRWFTSAKPSNYWNG